MSCIAYTIPEALQRLRNNDPTLIGISLNGRQYSDDDLTELIDCLLNHPNVIGDLWLGRNKLTDKTGIKLGRYLATSTTIQRMVLFGNRFEETTYLTLAAALRINTSLQDLYLNDNQVDKHRINMAFIDAIMINPNRPSDSNWLLFDIQSNEYDYLKAEAERFGHPNLQSVLAAHFVQAF